MHKVLITGFSNFGDHHANPTEQMLQDFDSKDVLLQKLVLPVSFERSFEILKKSLDEFQPDWVLLCGLAANREQITIEKIAINHIAARIPDADGDQPMDVVVEQEGEDGLFANFPIYSCIQYLNQRNIKLQASYSAGTYVCNYILYKTLSYLRNKKTQTTFIHFPNMQNHEDLLEFQEFLHHMLSFIYGGSKLPKAIDFIVGVES